MQNMPICSANQTTFDPKIIDMLTSDEQIFVVDEVADGECSRSQRGR